MKKKGSWFGTVKKALSFEKTQKSNKKYGKTPEGANFVARATATAVEGGCLTSSPRYLGKSTEEIAAVRIQIVFRGYLARKALRALKGLKRLKSLIQGQSVQRQATTTLKCMQKLARVQSQTQARRTIMSEQNRALQKLLQHKREKELQKSRSSKGGNFNVSAQSKEQIEAKHQHRQKAAMLREKALAYSFTHQRSWKNPLKPVNQPVNQIVTDHNIPQWSWSWLERWMTARPWEMRSALDNNDHGTVKSVVAGITKAYSQGDLSADHKKRSSTSVKSTQPRSSSIPPKAQSNSSVSIKTRFPSPSPTYGNLSKHKKRHSTGELSVGDDEIFASSPPVPSNKMSTKSRSPSNETLKKGPARSTMKRLSYPTSPVRTRRQSGSSKVVI